MVRRAITCAFFLVACDDPSPVISDGGMPFDAPIDRKIPPMSDAGDAAPPVTGPSHLADTGLYSDFESRTLAPNIVTYEPRYPLWADGASKKRYLLLPPNTKVDTSAMDDWIFPVDTKVWKEFDVAGVAIETRLLWKVNATQWWEVAYAWTADGSDAVAAPDGITNALGTSHDVPSQMDCNACHSGVSDVIIGVSAIQLGASDGDGTLANLAAKSTLTNAPTSTAFDVPGSGVTKDALGYLHGNCGHCHNSTSPIRNQTQMRLRLSTLDTSPEKTDAYTTSLFLPMKHVVPPNVTVALYPGSPDASGISVRMDRRDSFAMPAKCTKIVDDAGVATVSAWIASLPCGTPCAITPAQ